MAIEKENLYQRFKESVRFGDKFLPHYHVSNLIFASSYQTFNTFNSTSVPTATTTSAVSTASSSSSTSTEAEFIDLIDYKLINQYEYKTQYVNEMIHSVSNDYLTFTKLTLTKENEYQFSTNIFEIKSIDEIVSSDTQEKKLSYITNLEFIEKSKPNKYFNTMFHSQHDAIVGVLEQNTNSAFFKAYMLIKKCSYKIGNNNHADNEMDVDFKAHELFQYSFPHEIYFFKWSNTYVTNVLLAVGKYNIYVFDQQNVKNKSVQLVEEIINADFSYNDEWISVSTIFDESKRFIHMLNHQLNHIYKIAEYKNEKTVVLSTKKYKDKDPSEKEKVWLFTCGEVSKNEKKLAYSIYKLKNGVIFKF
jgi:hypothetical protein